MKTTINKIKSLKACSTGYVRLIKQLGSDFNKDEEFEVSSLVGGKNEISDITWLMGKNKNKKALVEFAVFSAELVLPIYEKLNDSKAPRKAIELVKKWLNNEESVSNKELRAYAAYAADAAAAYAAYAAAYAADADAAAAYAAYAAAYAADAYAADAYAADAAAAGIKDKINKKLISLLDGLG